MYIFCVWWVTHVSHVLPVVSGLLYTVFYTPGADWFRPRRSCALSKQPVYSQLIGVVLIVGVCSAISAVFGGVVVKGSLAE